MAAAWGLVAVTTWLLLHSAIIAPKVALGNLRGDWLVPLLTGALGCYAGCRLPARLALRAIVLPLLAQVTWMMGWQLWFWLKTGATGGWPGGIVPIGERDYFSSIVGFLLALTLAQRLAGMDPNVTEGPCSKKFGWAALVAGVLADAATRVRNGTLVSTAMLVAASLTMSRRQPRVLLMLFVVAALGGASAMLDKRWGRTVESLVVGWESDSLYWQSWDTSIRPPTPSGSPLEESAYARAAWAHQAATAIAEHPLGLGFGRDAFGRAVEMKYGYKGMVSSHSGWLDFTLAAGLPGMALLLLAAGLAIRGGWRQFRQHDDAAGLMFSFLVGGYLLRCLLDGHMSGWRLGLFAFLCGVLVAAMKPAPAKP